MRYLYLLCKRNGSYFIHYYVPNRDTGTGKDCEVIGIYTSRARAQIEKNILEGKF